MEYLAREHLNGNRLGLTFGIVIALMHAMWALVVALNLGQGFLDFVLPLHFLDNIYSVLEFNLLTATMLTVMAFLACYLLGWATALIWNWTGKISK